MGWPFLRSAWNQAVFEFQKLVDCERERGDSLAIIAVKEPLRTVRRSTEGKLNVRWVIFYEDLE